MLQYIHPSSACTTSIAQLDAFAMATTNATLNVRHVGIVYSYHCLPHYGFVVDEVRYYTHKHTHI